MFIELVLSSLAAELLPCISMNYRFLGLTVMGYGTIYIISLPSSWLLS